MPEVTKALVLLLGKLTVFSPRHRLLSAHVPRQDNPENRALGAEVAAEKAVAVQRTSCSDGQRESCELRTRSTVHQTGSRRAKCQCPGIRGQKCSARGRSG